MALSGRKMSVTGEGGGDDTLASTEYYRERTSKVTAESLQKTREMLRLMNDCQDAGVNTLKELYGQGDQLTRTEQKLNETELEVDKAAVRVKNIKRDNDNCFLATFCSCCKKNPDSIQKRNIGKEKETAVDEVLAPRQRPVSTISTPTKTSASTVAGSGRYFERITGAKEEEAIEENLSLVSDHVSVLKDIAVSMNTEVGVQNDQIVRMNVTADRTHYKIDDTTKTASAIVKGSGPGHTCCCTIA